MVQVVLAAAACSIVVFAIGGLTGFHLAVVYQKRPNLVAVNVPAKLAVPDDYFGSISARVLARIHDLSILAAQHRSTIPASLWQAIDDLAQATQKLRQQLEGVTHKAVQAIPVNYAHSDFVRADKACDAACDSCLPDSGGSQPSIIEGTSFALTGREFQELTVDEAEKDNCIQSLKKKKRKYEARQVIYRFYETEEGRALAPAATVRCHDLGVEGVSFFWPKAPDFETFVIALGTPEKPLYMLGEVMSSKAVVMHSEACYLVGCRFRSRLTRFSDIIELRDDGKQLVQNWTDSEVALV
jgi:hypothetical protein